MMNMHTHSQTMSRSRTLTLEMTFQFKNLMVSQSIMFEVWMFLAIDVFGIFCYKKISATHDGMGIHSFWVLMNHRVGQRTPCSLNQICVNDEMKMTVHFRFFSGPFFLSLLSSCILLFSLLLLRAKLYATSNYPSNKPFFPPRKKWGMRLP